MERSRARTLAIVVAVSVWAVVTPFLWRDLHRRPADQIRGPKWLWVILSANLSGTVAYFLFGRRPAPDGA
jgi:hypothetical protein